MVSLCLCVFASLCLFSRCMEGGLDLTQPKLDRCSRFYSIRRASVPLKRRNARHLCITAPSTIVFHNHNALDLKHHVPETQLGRESQILWVQNFLRKVWSKAWPLKIVLTFSFHTQCRQNARWTWHKGVFGIYEKTLSKSIWYLPLGISSHMGHH